MSNEFDHLVTSLGLPPIRFHDLRHVAATLGLAAGVDMKVIQEMLGYASLNVTSDLYSSVLPELAESAAEATTALVPRAAVGTAKDLSGSPRAPQGFRR